MVLQVQLFVSGLFYCCVALRDIYGHVKQTLPTPKVALGNNFVIQIPENDKNAAQ
jgi:hypothetical protein